MICLSVHVKIHVLLNFFVEFDVKMRVAKIDFQSPPPFLKVRKNLFPIEKSEIWGTDYLAVWFAAIGYRKRIMVLAWILKTMASNAVRASLLPVTICKRHVLRNILAKFDVR